MADTVSAAVRSAMMRSVRQKHTNPEQIVRRLLHNLGLRYTIDGPLNRNLPSRPDIVLPRWRTVVLVHGCFWHRHPRCVLASMPADRADFWRAKFDANGRRDALQSAA